MNKPQDNQELAKQFAVLEERMNTHQAKIDSTLNALRADQNALRAELRTRELTMILTVIGLLTAGITILGFILN